MILLRRIPGYLYVGYVKPVLEDINMNIDTEEVTVIFGTILRVG